TTPANTPTTTPLPTTTPTATAIAAFPYAASGGPTNHCTSGPWAGPPAVTPGAGSYPHSDSGVSSEIYCPGTYHVGDTVTVFADDGGYYNSHDSSFKGYVGYGPFTIGREYDVPPGDRGNKPSICPSTVRIPIISQVDHQGNGAGSDVYFVVVGFMTVNIDPKNCGSKTTGTIAPLSMQLPGDD